MPRKGKDSEDRLLAATRAAKLSRSYDLPAEPCSTSAADSPFTSSSSADAGAFDTQPSTSTIGFCGDSLTSVSQRKLGIEASHSEDTVPLNDVDAPSQKWLIAHVDLLTKLLADALFPN